MVEKRCSLGPSLAQQNAAFDRMMGRYEREKKWPWQDFLTDEERETIARADAAKAEWQRLNQARAGITNRAIQRAKYAALHKDKP